MPGSRLRRPPGALALGLAVLVGAAGTIGMKVSADQRTDRVERVHRAWSTELEKPVNDAPAENYLLVGSDSRQGIAADDPNAGAIGNTDDVVNSRSDTIMVLRRERNGGAALLSLPRDLWVPIAGTDRSVEDQLGLQRGLAAPRRHRHPGPRHPHQPLRGDRLRRLPEARRRDRRGRGLHVRAGPGHPLRAAPRPRLHERRRLAGPRLRPQPLLRGVDRRRLARGRHRRPRPHQAPAAVHPHARSRSCCRRWRTTRSRSASSSAWRRRSVTVDESLDPVKAAAALRQAAEVGLEHVLAAGRRRRAQGPVGARPRRGRGPADPRLLPRDRPAPPPTTPPTTGG